MAFQEKFKTTETNNQENEIAKELSRYTNERQELKDSMENNTNPVESQLEKNEAIYKESLSKLKQEYKGRKNRSKKNLINTLERIDTSNLLEAIQKYKNEKMIHHITSLRMSSNPEFNPLSSVAFVTIDKTVP